MSAPLSPRDMERHFPVVRRDEGPTLVGDAGLTLVSRLESRDTLLELLRSVHSTLEPGRVGDLIIAHLVDWLQLRTWSLVATDASGQRSLVSERGWSTGDEPLATAVASWVIAHGEKLILSDVSQDPRFGGTEGRAAVGFPLRSRGRLVGVLVGLDSASASRPHEVGRVWDALLPLLETAATAFENALLFKRAEALSVTDDLTGLYNSRYLRQVLARETKRSARAARPLSLLFIDLDGFKTINDSYGHLAGSRALVEAGAVIRWCGRETDVAARFGGDEFALVLPETGASGALAVAHRVRERVAAHGFLAAEGHEIHLTCSVGVATLPDAARSPEELVQASDAAMYEVKARGKNDIAVAGPVPLR